MSNTYVNNNYIYPLCNPCKRLIFIYYITSFKLSPNLTWVWVVHFSICLVMNDWQALDSSIRGTDGDGERKKDLGTWTNVIVSVLQEAQDLLTAWASGLVLNLLLCLGNAWVYCGWPVTLLVGSLASHTPGS